MTNELQPTLTLRLRAIRSNSVTNELPLCGYNTATISTLSNIILFYIIFKQVKLELFLGGHRKVWILFDGRNSNITSWFSRGNFMKSSYKDLSRDSHFEVFSIQG